MDNIIVNIKKVNQETGSSETKGKLPIYATSGAAGADLMACLDQTMTIKPGERAAVPTGIAMELPNPNLVALVFARSGLASKKGLALSNGVGVVDSDYRGEIKVLMINHGQEDVVIQNGDRIAQMLLLEVSKAIFTEVDELGDTARGEGGFGSTGEK